ncbi:protein of unknown function (plasmid) [Cupriavidus taiwanensis]|uniref:Uncharacterized protein n=1 Tax=Cupriavidus taiwanensis TaxID=164546 RepID=A0A375FHD0_9BURK|nr:protein of unknown function [Cupriavidus taiwanensis]SPD67754.1 protein of unknown function [Cupriavidus taiwanensis]
MLAAAGSAIANSVNARKGRFMLSPRLACRRPHRRRGTYLIHNQISIVVLLTASQIRRYH